MTTNAAGAGLQWDMTAILPQQPGLVVNNVIYRYTAVKQQQDEMYVDVQNENALGDGFIFKERDDWTNLPGNTITKTVPVGSIPIQYWGNGEVKVTGTGSVSNAQVAYSYRYDTCFDPINDPSCPGYDAAMAEFLKGLNLINQTTEYKDSLEDENVKDVLEQKADVKEKEKEDEEQKEKDKKRQADKDKRRQIALKAAESAVSSAMEISQAAMLEAMSNVPAFESYYVSALKGGVYPDAEMYKITKVPENKRGLRMGLAQQIKHDQMIDQQYKKQ